MSRKVRRDRVELDVDAARTPVALPDAALRLLNDGDLTYAKVRLDASSLDTVERALDRVVDPLARGLIWSALWNATRDGELDPERYLAMARAFAPAETNTALSTAMLANASFAIAHYLPTDARDRWRRDWLETCWAAMEESAPGSGGQLAWARAAAAAAVVDDRRAADIRAILDGDRPAPAGLPLDPDLRWAWWTALSATGHADPDDLDAELVRDDTASGRTAQLRALAARPDANVKARAWQSALEDTTLSNDQLDAVIGGFRAGERRDLIAGYDDAYFAALRGVWVQRSIEIARRVVLGLFPAAESLDAVDAWLASNTDAPDALRRLVTEQRDHLARDLRVRAAWC